jgi:hypothetical protein
MSGIDTVYTLTATNNGQLGVNELSSTFNPESGSLIVGQYVGGNNVKSHNRAPGTDGSATTANAQYWFVDTNGQWLQITAGLCRPTSERSLPSR